MVAEAGGGRGWLVGEGWGLVGEGGWLVGRGVVSVGGGGLVWEEEGWG